MYFTLSPTRLLATFPTRDKYILTDVFTRNSRPRWALNLETSQVLSGPREKKTPIVIVSQVA